MQVAALPNCASLPSSPPKNSDCTEKWGGWSRREGSVLGMFGRRDRRRLADLRNFPDHPTLPIPHVWRLFGRPNSLSRKGLRAEQGL
jgi:hypothetical protein